ncbi:hypothetical protein B0J13DRAFT_546188 [Dactylonectria estremocensis]|uniref:Uncharacterized protein n=1 Tax=Dactylonectria estremocensis TaxID=1079267 RepID=A0A9P9F8E2_9HYPO|nr:hypothetical protein B0J13DRAFT_546188 [Dactylonectria estremocensis]
MTPFSSPPREVAEFLTRRNLTSIPKDQQVLLDEPDSWAVDLKNKHHGLANVPGHVLDTTKMAYIARTSASNVMKSQSQPPAQSPIQSMPKHISHSGSTSSPSREDLPRTQNGHPESPPDSPEIPIEWSLSPPERQPRLPRMPVESSIVHETPKGVLMAPPPRPALPFSFPSSDGPEEDLEVDIPQPQVLRDVPVNRAAARLKTTVHLPVSSETPMATPPCAQPSLPTQPTIPNTVVANKPTVTLAPSEQRRERRMKAIQFNDKTPKKLQPGMNRLAPTKTFTEIESSISTSPSSIIPATFEEPLFGGSIIESVEMSRDIEMDDEYDEKTDEIETVVEQSQIQAPVASSYKSQQGPEEIYEDIRTKAPTPQIIPGEDLKPFKVFTRAYPTYTENHSGTLWDFIKACVYLDWLRRRRQLRDCLYDDFIRAFADYQVYVRNARTGQQALVAIEWFNNLSGPPLFNDMVVTKENLSWILDSYEKEVAKASKIVADDDGTDEEVVEVGRLPLSLDETMNIDRHESLGRPIATSALPASRPRGILTQAPPPPSPSWNSTALPSTIATPATRTRRPRASNYLGNLASGVNSKSTPRRRTAEERAKLREHFLKRKSADSRGVTSSKLGQ